MEDFKMSIEFSIDDVEDINDFIENYLVDAMNKSGMSFPAMAITLQTLTEKVSELRIVFEEENNEN